MDDFSYIIHKIFGLLEFIDLLLLLFGATMIFTVRDQLFSVQGNKSERKANTGKIGLSLIFVGVLLKSFLYAVDFIIYSIMQS